MYTVFGDKKSGNCYKIELILNILQLEYKWVDIDILQHQTQTDEFKQKNPNTQVPVLRLEDGTYLFESNAILFYLAQSTHLFSNDNYIGAQIIQWMCFEQYSHEPYIAVARFISKYLGLPNEKLEEYNSKQQGGNKALRVMNKHLQQHKFFVDDEFSIADIALFAYTHVAEEGGFNLSMYPHILRWLENVKSVPNFTTMERA